MSAALTSRTVVALHQSQLIVAEPANLHVMSLSDANRCATGWFYGRPISSCTAMKSLVDPFSKPGHVIRRLQQYAVLIFHEETAGFDLTPTQYVTLQVVEHRPGIDQVTLCELTAIDRSMTARIVEALARRGLIDKRPAAKDRRANSLFLTAKAPPAARDDRAERRSVAGQDFGAVASGRAAPVHAAGATTARRLREATREGPRIGLEFAAILRDALALARASRRMATSTTPLAPRYCRQPRAPGRS